MVLAEQQFAIIWERLYIGVQCALDPFGYSSCVFLTSPRSSTCTIRGGSSLMRYVPSTCSVNLGNVPRFVRRCLAFSTCFWSSSLPLLFANPKLCPMWRCWYH